MASGLVIGDRRLLLCITLYRIGDQLGFRDNGNRHSSTFGDSTPLARPNGVRLVSNW